MKKIPFSKLVALSISVVVSAILLVMLIVLYGKKKELLDLPVQWIFVAFAPFIFTSFFLGFIKKFKGFGVEIESFFDNPLPQKDITTAILEFQMKKYREEDAVIQKGATYSIESLPSSERVKYKRLSFVSESHYVYSTDAITTYIRCLPNLKYIEIVDAEDSFLALLPVAEIKGKRSATDRFVNNVANPNDLKKVFGDSIITDYVYEEDPLKRILKMFLENNYVAIGLTRNRKLVGVIERESIFSTIVGNIYNLIK